MYDCSESDLTGDWRGITLGARVAADVPTVRSQ